MKRVLIFIFVLLISATCLAERCIEVDERPIWDKVFLYEGSPYTGCVSFGGYCGENYHLNEGWTETHEDFDCLGHLKSIRKFDKGKLISLVAYYESDDIDLHRGDERIKLESIFEYGDNVLNHRKEYYYNGILKTDTIYKFDNNKLDGGRLMRKTDYYQDGSEIGKSLVKDFFFNLERIFVKNWLYVIITGFFISIIFVKLLPRTSYTVNTLMLIFCYYLFTRNWYNYYVCPTEISKHFSVFLSVLMAIFISLIPRFLIFPRLSVKFSLQDKKVLFTSIVFIIISSVDFFSPRGIVRLMVSLIAGILAIGTMLLIYQKNLRLISEQINKKRKK